MPKSIVETKKTLQRGQQSIEEQEAKMRELEFKMDMIMDIAWQEESRSIGIDKCP